MFKKLIFLLSIIAVVSCEKETEGFVINGKIDATANGKLATLTSIDRSEPTILDTATVVNGSVTLKGTITTPDLYLLTIENIQGRLPIMVENETMEVILYADSLQSSLVNGSKENEMFKSFQDIAKPLQKQNIVLGNKYREAQSKNDMTTMQAVRKTFDSLVAANNTKSVKSISTNNNSITSAIILEDLLRAKSIDLPKANDLHTNFTDYVKNSRPAKEVKRVIDASLATEIGSKAPEFSAPNPAGETIALNDIKGKVTIIDFWAAWCGPCRKENPNVVNVYKKYHDKGLEIIGVSLDGSSRQPNAKDAWMKAIASDSLNWHQVSNLKYFDDPVAKLYNIQSIPATFILDSDGKIVAKNLRGPALEQKIAELLN